MSFVIVTGFEELIQKRTSDEHSPTDYRTYENLVEENTRRFQKCISVESDNSCIIEGNVGKYNVRKSDNRVTETETDILLLKIGIRHNDKCHNTGTNPYSDNRIIYSEITGNTKSRNHSKCTKVAHKRNKRKRGGWSKK